MSFLSVRKNYKPIYYFTFDIFVLSLKSLCMRMVTVWQYGDEKMVMTQARSIHRCLKHFLCGNIELVTILTENWM